MSDLAMPVRRERAKWLFFAAMTRPDIVLTLRQIAGPRRAVAG